jgi:hypothetical protein
MTKQCPSRQYTPPVFAQQPVTGSYADNAQLEKLKFTTSSGATPQAVEAGEIDPSMNPWPLPSTYESVVASQRPTLLSGAPQRRKEAFGSSRMFGAYGQISPVAADRRHAVGRVSIGFNMSDASMAKHAVQCNRHGLRPKRSLGEATFRQLSQRTYPRNHTRERSAARHLPTSHRQPAPDQRVM